jgi:hypothetical protein
MTYLEVQGIAYLDLEVVRTLVDDGRVSNDRPPLIR